MWPHITAQTTGPWMAPSDNSIHRINTGFISCSKAPDQDLAFGHIPDTPVASWLFTWVSWFLTTQLSRSALLSNPQTIPPLPLFYLPILFSLTTVMPNYSAPELFVGSQVLLGWVLPTPVTGMAQSCCLFSFSWPGLETLGSTWYDGRGRAKGSWSFVAPSDQTSGVMPTVSNNDSGPGSVPGWLWPQRHKDLRECHLCPPLEDIL